MLENLTELEDHCYSTVKSAHSIVNDVNDRNNHEYYSDLRVSETHDSGEEEDKSVLSSTTRLQKIYNPIITLTALSVPPLPPFVANPFSR